MNGYENQDFSLEPSSDLIADIQNDKINIIKSRYSSPGEKSPEILSKEIEYVLNKIDKTLQYLNYSFKLEISNRGFGNFDVKDFKPEKGGVMKRYGIKKVDYTLYGKIDLNDINQSSIEDPELSPAYEDSKLWVIAYDTGFKNIEIVENGTYTTKKQAEDVAKELSNTDMFIGTELTVIGIPIKNINYGDTFFVPGEEESLIEIEDNLFFEMAKRAHQENKTVNELANELLGEHITTNPNFSDKDFNG